MAVNEDERFRQGRYSIMSLDPREFKRHPPEHDIRDLRPAVQSNPSSFFYISSKFESLDYQEIESRLIVEEEKMQTYSYFVKKSVFRFINLIGAAILIALIGAFLDFSIKEIGHAKYSFLSKFVDNNYKKLHKGYFMFVFVWYLTVIVPVMLSSCIVVFIAPYAAGGGVAQMISYLNGVRVPNVLKFRCLFVKMFSTVLTCSSGLAGGKEGPMLHMGAIVGSRFSGLFARSKCCQLYQDFQTDQEKRDMAAAGFAAGLACAFNAPIGGLLLAVEEGISYWNIDLMWKIFICSITSVFFVIMLMSIVEGAPGYFNNPELLTLGKIEDITTNYEYFELFYFIIVGAIGALFGSMLVHLHMHMTNIRMRYINTKARKLVESFAVACVIASLSMIAVFTYTKCRKLSYKTEGGGHGANLTVGQVYCDNGEYSVMSLLTYQNQEGLIHLMFSQVNDDSDIGALSCLLLIYFVNVNLTMGLSLSAGIFVPQIVFGSVWGRIFGLLIRRLHNNAAWAVPSKYAYLGAAAQLSGTIRKTFSVMVIMIEASGNISFGIPLMLVVATVRVIGNFFTLPIYELQAHMAGIPLLYSDPPPISKELKATEVMSQNPLCILPLLAQVKEILYVLDMTKHNGFPIVRLLKKDGGTSKIKGLILRRDLLIILKYKVYKYPPPVTTKEFLEHRAVFKAEIDHEIDILSLVIREKYFSATIDLSPYMNPYPYTRYETSSLNNVYRLFRCIGLRHLVIVNDSNEAVGIITRKDLAKYHVWEQNCMMGVKELGLGVR